ncbi:MAG: RluA family pseudouridine synthase [Eubacteriales bacterium]|jgi:23S rRNA pseudouridine1911/1915/1917 synthase
MVTLLTHTVAPEEEGRTVDWVLRRKLGLSTRIIQRLKREPEGITVDGQPQWVNHPLRAGEQVRAALRETQTTSVCPTPGPVTVVYEDEEILVVDKPPLVPVHPVPGNRTHTLANFLAFRYAGQEQPFVPRILTRLDKNTSGLVLLARNAYAAHQLTRQLEAHTIRKEYQALVVGRPDQPCGLVDTPIGRKEGSVLLREVRPDGKPAVTRWEIQQAAGPFTLLRVWPLTGRTHQIRVHMAHLGYPLVGDFLYGTECPQLLPRHGLHMARLTLEHPRTGQTLSFHSPLPPDLSVLLQPQIV